MLWDIATPLLVIALLVAGFFWLTSAGSEEKVSKGKSILFSAVIGFIIVFGAWLIVNTLLTTLGQTQIYAPSPQSVAMPQEVVRAPELVSELDLLARERVQAARHLLVVY